MKNGYVKRRWFLAGIVSVMLAMMAGPAVDDVLAGTRKHPGKSGDSSGNRIMSSTSRKYNKSGDGSIVVYPDRNVTQIFNYTPLNLEYVIGEPKVEIMMDVEEIGEHIRVTQDGSKLFFQSYDDDIRMSGNITVSLPNLTSLYSYSIADIHAGRLKGDKVSVYGYGVGSVKIGEADVESLTLCQGGVGDMVVDKVHCQSARLLQNGVGELKVRSLTATDAELVHNGVGDLRVPHLSGQIVRVNNNGVGNVVISGDECRSLTLISHGVGDIIARGMKAVKLIRIEEGTGSIRM